TFKQTFETITFLETKVVMAGTFKKASDLDDAVLETFCNINAPAIIFPFIREMISSMSLKAGVQPILIQPINFVDLSKVALKNEQSRFFIITKAIYWVSPF